MDNCVIFTINKCENDINEWIVHHILLGFQHIYIYDDNSIIPILSTISILPDNIKACVTVYTLTNEYEINPNKLNAPIPELIYYDEEIYNRFNHEKQLYFYNYFVKYHKDKAKWVLCCDVDEYVYLSIDTNINDYIESVQEYDIIFLPWVMYGTSYFTDKPSGLIIDNFRCHESSYFGTGKSIINIKNIKQITHVHTINNINNIHRPNVLNVKIGELRAHLNHYFTKDCKSFYSKKMKIARGQTNFFERTPSSIIGPTVSPQFNKCTNHIMEKYVNRIIDILHVPNALNFNFNIYTHILRKDNKIINHKYVLNNCTTYSDVEDFILKPLEYILKTSSDYTNILIKYGENIDRAIIDEFSS